MKSLGTNNNAPVLLDDLGFFLNRAIYYLFGENKLPDGIFGEFLLFGYFLGSIVLAIFLSDYFF